MEATAPSAQIKAIKKQIAIAAPCGKVWEVLTRDELTRKWYAEFCPGAYAETDWQHGSAAQFKDPEGNGLIGEIEVSKPAEELSIAFTGQLLKGVADYDSAEARALKGSHEKYWLSPHAGGTVLAIEADMSERYFDSMSAAWDRALQKVKELAEAR